MLQTLFDAIERNRDIILAAERYIWQHPELGYREWQTHAYLKAQYEAIGYDVQEAGNIPGFFVDIDTGRPGPRVAVFGEMDAIVVPDHPQCNPETKAVHACGHHFQSAALLGVAIALKAEGALDGLCGSIRLLVVPCEEEISHKFCNSLMQQNVIHFHSGKREFLYRGYLDGVDIAFMVHGRSKGFALNGGCNGSIRKQFIFIGKAAHAAGAAHGRNALYAATNAIACANALRETFLERDTVRFHPIITKGGAVVNVIPDSVCVESAVRALSMSALMSANAKINRAFAAGAASMGCRLIIDDASGYAPRKEDKNLQSAFLEIARLLFDASEIHTGLPPATGCTDMGDVSMVMPVCHAFVGGGAGEGHTAEYRVDDPVTGCVTNAKLQVGVLAHLLCDESARAKKVIAEAEVPYPSIQAYLEAVERLSYREEAVIYNEDGSTTLKC